MELELYTRVALTRDIPERNLKRGDVAMLIDTVPDPDTGKDDYILEIFNAIGETLDVAIVPPTAIAPLRANEVLSVRVLAEA
ncbi:MAG: DUF4926 domain-containing protein [Geitlerinemataceae cyanobacterium]